MNPRPLPFNYRCGAGHVQASQRPLTSCRAMRQGKPCPAPLTRVGPGSRSKSNTNPNTTAPGEPTIMSTTAKTTARKSTTKTTSKVGAVNTKPKATKAASTPAPVAKPETVAPAAAAGYTNVKLRSARNTEIIAAHCTVKGAIKVTGPWITVTNAKAQELFDQLNEAGKSAAIFDRRVIDYFTATLAIARPTIKDDRTSVHAQVLAAGRAGLKAGDLTSFGFVMKTDGTLKVEAVAKDGTTTLFGTQRDALSKLAA